MFRGSPDKVRVRAVYKGKDDSLGYRTGRTYDLYMWIEKGYICVEDVYRLPTCPYKPSMFPKIWELV